MKRFYKTVAAVAGDDGWGIALDGRAVRTPARVPLVVPSVALAQAIVAEWDAQVDEIKPLTMPLTGLSNAAIDRVAPDRAGFARGLAAYAETELLAYRADHPAPLVARQAAGWDPLLAWARQRYDVAFTVTTGIVHVAQPSATLARIGAAFASLDAFRLAALNQAVTITGSSVIALALSESYLDAAKAYAAGHLDELWQAEQWGSDPLAEAPRAERLANLTAAARLLALL
jgi:chaperone required for assembly of F1-ATPase